MYQVLQQIDNLFTQLFLTQNNSETQIYIDNKCRTDLSNELKWRGMDKSTLDFYANGKKVLTVSSNIVNDNKYDITVTGIEFFTPPPESQDMVDFVELGYVDSYRTDATQKLKEYVNRHNAADNGQYTLKNISGDVATLAQQIKTSLDDYLIVNEIVNKTDKTIVGLASTYATSDIASFMEIYRRLKEDKELATQNTPEGREAAARVAEFNKAFDMGDFISKIHAHMNNEEKLNASTSESPGESATNPDEQVNTALPQGSTGIGNVGFKKTDNGPASAADFKWLEHDDDEEDAQANPTYEEKKPLTDPYSPDALELVEDVIEEEEEEDSESNNKKKDDVKKVTEKSLDEEFDDIFGPDD